MRTFQMVTSYTAWKQQDSRLPAVSLMGFVPPTPRFWGQFPPPVALSIHTPPNQCFSVFSRHCFFVFPLSFSFYSTSLTAVAPQHQGEFIPSHPPSLELPKKHRGPARAFAGCLWAVFLQCWWGCWDTCKP